MRLIPTRSAIRPNALPPTEPCPWQSSLCMLSICMDVSQVDLNSVDCTGVINACDDLTASEYEASSMVPRWISLPLFYTGYTAAFDTAIYTAMASLYRAVGSTLRQLSALRSQVLRRGER